MWEYFSEGKFLSDIKFYLLVFLLFLGVITWRSCKDRRDSIPNIEYKAPEKTWVDEKKKTHSEITSVPVSSKILESLVDSLISENKKLRNATSLIQVSTKIDTVFKERIVWRDTTTGDFELSKKDDWIDVVAKGNIKSGEGEIRVGITDTISVVTKTKKHLFKPNETIIDFSTANPYNKTQAMRSFTIPERKSIVSIGPTASYSWNGTKWSPSIGIGVTYNLFSIKTRK